MTGGWRLAAAAVLALANTLALALALSLALSLALAPWAVAATKGAAAPAPRTAPASAVTAAPAASPAAAASAPVEFTGELEAGRSYVGDFFYDPNALHLWRPVKDVQVAKNSAWMIDWTNLAQFPALASAPARAKPQRLRFKVLKVEVSSGAPTLPWTVIYHLAIEAVEKPIAPSPSAGKHR